MDEKFVIRAYRPADAALLAPVYNALHLRRPRTAVQLHRDFGDVVAGNGRIWVISRSGAFAGYASVAPLPGLPGMVELRGGIAPALRGQGLGSALLAHLLAALRGRDVTMLTCHVPTLDAPVARFLLARGFSLEHEEQQMQLDDLQARPPAPGPRPPAPCRLERIDPQTAVRTFPALYDQCFAHTPWYQPFSAAEVAATLRHPDQMLYLYESDRPVGFVWLHFRGKTAVIEPIGIVREKQRQGYGRYLMHHTLHQLQFAGITSVQLSVWASNNVAIHLYRQFGFTHRHTDTYLAAPIS